MAAKAALSLDCLHPPAPEALLMPNRRHLLSLAVALSVLTAAPEFDVRHDKVALSSGCESHPATLLPPEATGAVMEETKWLKPSV